MATEWTPSFAHPQILLTPAATCVIHSCLVTLRDERLPNLTNRNSALHYVALWEQNAIELTLPIVTRSLEAARSEGTKDPAIASSLGPVDLWFLIYALSTVQRWSISKRVNASRAIIQERQALLETLWELVDENTPVVVIIPLRPMLEVIIPYLRRHAETPTSKFDSPDSVASPDEWSVNVVDQITKLLSTLGHLPEDIPNRLFVPFPCSLIDMIKLLGTSYRLRDNAQTHAHIAAATEIIKYLNYYAGPTVALTNSTQQTERVSQSNSESLSTVPISGGHLTYAGETVGVLRRYFAYNIDLVGLVTPFFCVLVAISAYEDNNPGFGGTLAVLTMLSFVVALCLYFILMEGLAGRTLGKKLLGIKVIRVDGSPMTMKASLVRNCLRIIDSLFYGAVGALVVINSARNQRLGDMAAKTLVIYDRNQ